MALTKYEPYSAAMSAASKSRQPKDYSWMLTAPAYDPRWAGFRLRAFRKHVLKLDNHRAAAEKFGFKENQWGNWERGAPFHRYVLQIAAARVGLSSIYFYSGRFEGTSVEVMDEILAAERAELAEWAAKGITVPSSGAPRLPQ